MCHCLILCIICHISHAFLVDLGKAKPDWLINSFSDDLWKYLYGAATPKRLKMVLQVMKQTIYTFFSEMLNLEGHQNRCIGSKVTAILMNGWILPTGGASLGRVCACSLRSRLVFILSLIFFFKKIWTMWWSQSVEGLLSTGLPRLASRLVDAQTDLMFYLQLTEVVAGCSNFLSKVWSSQQQLFTSLEHI